MRKACNFEAAASAGAQRAGRAEEKLNRYRQQNDSVDLNTEAKAVLEQIVNADNQLNELTFREAEISQLYKRSPHLPGAD